MSDTPVDLTVSPGKPAKNYMELRDIADGEVFYSPGRDCYYMRVGLPPFFGPDSVGCVVLSHFAGSVALLPRTERVKKVTRGTFTWEPRYKSSLTPGEE